MPAKELTFSIKAKDCDREVLVAVVVNPGDGLMREEATALKTTLADAIMRAVAGGTVRYFNPNISQVKVKG